MSFTIDMTDDATREAVMLISAESALALELNTGMKLSRGFSALKAAKHYGFTDKGTKHGALLDVVGLRRFCEGERYNPSEATTVKALVKHFGEERARKEIAKVLRKADKDRAKVLAEKGLAQ